MPLGGRGHPSEGPATKRRKPAEVSPGSPLFPEVGQGCTSEPPGRRRQHEARGRVQPPSGGAQSPAPNLQLGVGYLLQSRSLTGEAAGEGPWARAGRRAGGRQGRSHLLTCTHSYCVPRAVPAVVAVEAPVGVTDGSLRAVVPELLCAHLAALAAVRDEADPQRAAGRRRRTRARPLAELRARGRVLQRRRGPGHGRGGWGEALRGNGRGEGGGASGRGF